MNDEKTLPEANITELDEQQNEEERIRKREEEIAKRKNKFDKFTGLIKLIIFLILLTLSGAYIYSRYHTKDVPHVIVTEPPVSTEPVSIKKTIVYKSDFLKLSLEYPSEAKLVESELSDKKTKKIEVMLDKKNTDYTKINETTLKDGYIFRIYTFNTNLRDFDEIAQTRLKSFRELCPDTATTSEVSGGLIDTIEARTFTVTNCGVDYVVTYVPRFNQYYEFSQIYIGDLGFKQQYRSQTDDILQSIRFYPEESEIKPDDPFTTFENKQYLMSFVHPKLSDSCCDLPGPASRNPQRLVVLGDAKTFQDKNNFDGIGVFVDSFEAPDTFDTYLSKQKQLMLDDYVVVKGTKPTDVNEKQIQVGNLPAVMISGINWKGLTYVYINMAPVRPDNRVMVLVIKNISGNSFDKTISGILDSFKFTKLEQ